MEKESTASFWAGSKSRKSPAFLYSLFGLDGFLLVCLILLFGLGTLVVYTAAYGSVNFEILWFRHLAALMLALLFGFLVLFLSPAFVAETSYFFYGLSVLLLIAVLFFGKTVHGSKSWFDLGPFQFQPSELAKLGVIFCLSRLQLRFREKDPYLSLSSRFKILLTAALPMALVLAQGDLSAVLSFSFIVLAYAWFMELVSSRIILIFVFFCLGMFLLLLAHIVAGLTLPELGKVSAICSRLGFGPGATFVKGGIWLVSFVVASIFIYRILRELLILPGKTTWWWPIALALFFIVTATASYATYRTLRGYQKNRLVSFLFTKADPLGSGYSITQSKIAIGSGGLVGRGILSGSQTSMGFLPERHTDFAFAALGEALGFMGTMATLALFGVLFWRLSHFVELARDDWGKLVAAGLLGLWLGEVIINIAYVVGLFPIVGIGLPFLSYGGSRLVITGLEAGLLLAISRSFYVYR